MTKHVPWTKVDQTDFYALCVIDPKLAEEVKQIATREGKPFRDVLRSAVRQRQFRRESGLNKFWEKLSPEERTAHARKAALEGWKRNRSKSEDDRG
jgi:hypothetical protein